MGQKYNRGGYGGGKRSTNPHAPKPWYKNRWNVGVLVVFSIAGLIWVLGSLDTSSNAATGPAGGAMSPGGASNHIDGTGPSGAFAVVVLIGAALTVLAAALIVMRRAERAQQQATQAPVYADPFHTNTANSTDESQAVGGVGNGKTGVANSVTNHQ